MLTTVSTYTRNFMQGNSHHYMANQVSLALSPILTLLLACCALALCLCLSVSSYVNACLFVRTLNFGV